MATRRESRQWAMQVLFQLDLNPASNLPEVFATFWKGKKNDKKARLYTESVVAGVREHIKEIDDLVRKYAKNWNIKRMSVIDRNILRLGLYEMQYCDDVPPVVAINEAVDIAKIFGGTESGKFVNGIMDRIRESQVKT